MSRLPVSDSLAVIGLYKLLARCAASISTLFLNVVLWCVCSARIQDWVRQASSLQRRASDSLDGLAAQSPRFKGSEQDVPDAEAELHLVTAPGQRKADAADRLAADAASSDAAASFVEGVSEIGSEAESAMPPGDAAGQEEELAVDMR